MKINIKMILVSTILLSFGFLAGCQNTIAGIGQDMQHNGKELQRSVN